MLRGPHGEELIDKMGQWYDLTVRTVVGDDDGDDEEVTILKRTLKHTGDGLEYSVDPRHEGEIRAEFSIGCESKGLNAPARKEEVLDGFDEGRDDPRLDQACGRRYRGVVARATICRLTRSTCNSRQKKRASKCCTLGSVVRPE